MRRLPALWLIALAAIGTPARAGDDGSAEPARVEAESVERLVAELTSPNVADRRNAARALRERGRDAGAAAKALVGALCDSDEGVRRESAHALREIDLEIVRPLLRDFVREIVEPGRPVRMIRLPQILDDLGPRAGEVLDALAENAGSADPARATFALVELRSARPRSAVVVPKLLALFPTRWTPFDRILARTIADIDPDAAFASEIPVVRSAAIELAIDGATYGSSHAIEQLLSVVADPAEPLRGRAARAVGAGWIEVRESDRLERLPLVRGWLEHDPDPAVRAGGAAALAWYPRRWDSIGGALVKALSDPDAQVVFAALESLRVLGKDARTAVPDVIRVADAAESDAETVRRVATVLGAIGDGSDAAVSALARWSRRTDEKLVEACIDALMRTASNSAVSQDALLEATQNPVAPFFQRTQAPKYLVAPRGTDPLRVLRTVRAGAGDMTGVLIATRILGSLAERDAAERAQIAAELLLCLDHTSVHVRVWAAHNLSALVAGADEEDRGAWLPNLLHHFESDPEASGRAAAAAALGQFRDRADQVVPALIEALGREDDVKAADGAMDGLAALGEAARPAAPAILRAVARFEGRGETRLRKPAASALGCIGDTSDAVVRTLVSWTKRADLPTGQAVLAALGRLGRGSTSICDAIVRIALDRTVNYHLREQAARALGTMGERAAVEALSDWFEHDIDPPADLAWALVELDAPIAPRALAQLAELATDRTDPHLALRCIAELGPKAAPTVPAVAGQLASTFDEVRKLAALALGAIGPAAKDALPALERAFSDRDKDVAAAARAAVERIRSER